MSSRSVPTAQAELLLVGAALLIAVASMLAVWARLAPGAPDALERYYPLSSGVALSYRISNPDGTVSYQASNAEQLPSNDFMQLIDVAAFTSLMKLLHIDISNFDVDAAQAAAARERFARITDTDLASGAYTPTTSLVIIGSATVGLLQQEAMGFDPPLPLFATPDALKVPLVVTGAINASLPYTSSLILEAREPMTGPLGLSPDCLRLRSQLAVPGYSSTSVTWFCTGIGIARQEVTATTMSGSKQYELIAASTPGKIAHVESPPPLQAGQATQTRLFADGSGLPRLSWSFSETRGNNGITAPIVVANDLLLYATQNGAVVALDRSSQQLRWRFQTGSAIYSAPAVAGGIVYITSSDRKLYAVDLASGTFRWAFAAADVISGGAAVANGLVYVASDDRTLYALDALTGQERWRYAAGGPIAATPLVTAGVVYVGSDDGALYALDAATGTPLWAFASGGAMTAPAVIANGRVYIGSHNRVLYALEAQTDHKEGKQIWSFSSDQEIMTEPTVVDGTLYLAGTDRLWALDAASGVQRWFYDSQSRMAGAPLRMGNDLLVRRVNDILILDARTGAERSVVATSETPAYAGLSSDGHNIYVGDFNGLLQVFAVDGSGK